MSHFYNTINTIFSRFRFTTVPSALSDGVNGSSAPHPPPQPRHPAAPPPAVAGGDVVEHGVEAGVEDDERHGDAAGVVDGVGGGAAADDVHAAQQVEQVDEVVGQEAEQHDGQDDVDHPQGPARRFGLDGGDAPGDQRVAHQDDDGRQQRAEDQTQHAVRPQPRLPLLLGEVLEAAVPVGRPVNK